MFGLDRRQFVGLGLAAAGMMAVPRFLMAQEATGTVRWVSPRGTIEVLDDYPYWVAQKFGWFGDIETTLEPGPMEATATIKLVDQDQADVGFPSPGVFSLGLEQGMPLVSAFQMGAYDVFSFAFQKGKKPASATDLAGKKILLGSIGWKAIVDPMLAQVGVDPTSVEYAEAGGLWGPALQQGQGDAALCWEGLRAQWFGQGLDFDYILPYEFSKFPANTFVIRAADLTDAAKKPLYEAYFKAWAMGLEFGHQNPRAATQIVLEQFPALASTLKPDIATESMMQLAKVFRGPWDQRQGWGWHDLAQWQGYFDVIYRIKQITKEMKSGDVCKNDYTAAANQFDQAAVKKASDEFQLSSDFQAVDVAAIQARL
ncbi:MAG TPA: ABC transporter substrate-binding protein [Geminicoccus sp.]|uniref:ABC transporter substrate-binding protein n=1 Tax=Geminicoccus sp. TaxID=2024832 RepID=UPI002E32DF0E|nr:ABC transporter substrate-binding protein [Geminicoccus sp.]HEX2529758.1 ABC transporter substrate-binding protein [Geminicoccus sp.]